jgi:hypothetical protein
MTAATGLVLVSQIMPIITGAIARGTIKGVRTEDAAELVSEACAMAAAALESLEIRGKQVPAKSVAYYALQRLKSGRRSCGSGTTDVMSAGAALCGRAHLVSLDESAGSNDADDGAMTLHEMLADSGEGPDETAARELDWDALDAELGPKQRDVVCGVARGEPGTAMAAALKVSSPRIVQIKRAVARRLRQRWGNECIVELCRPPSWHWKIEVTRQRRAARYERSVA